MPRSLTNKQTIVLNLLRTEGPMTVKQVAKRIEETTPCPECGGSGDGPDARWGCRSCYGRGQVWFGYSTAYQALQRLVKTGDVTRSCMRDSFGDEVLMHLYMAAPQADPSDPLEKLWALPEAHHA